MTKADKIMALFEARKGKLVRQDQLSNISVVYQQYLFKLRSKGKQILSVPLKGGKGLWGYIYAGAR